MIGQILQGLFDTQANFIAAAAGVCALTATTLLLLTRNTHMATRADRAFVAVWIALVTGVGVWTTHFVAMLGYRPDAALTYNMQLTAISMFVGIGAIGIPVAASIFVPSSQIRAALGVIAGLGVAAMHLTGMTALENCITTYRPFVLGLGILAGVAGFAWALSQDPSSDGGQLYRAIGFVGGVCALHFIAMAAATIELTPLGALGIGGSFLSIMVALVSLAVLVVAMIGTFNRRRKMALQVAGY